MLLFRSSSHRRAAPRRTRTPALAGTIEHLESRTLMSGGTAAGAHPRPRFKADSSPVAITPASLPHKDNYAVEPGNRWVSPHLTFSFMPDGTSLGAAPSNLFTTWDAQFGPGVWEQQIERALATYAAASNLTFTQVADSGLPEDSPGLSQGDSRFGDIRIGGYNEQDPSLLGQGYYPPPDGATAAGDIIFNGGNNFHIGSDYDLYSVALHEIGHAIGLAHSADPMAVMYPDYQGVRTGLSADDIAGVQSIYGVPGPSPPSSAPPPANPPGSPSPAPPANNLPNPGHRRHRGPRHRHPPAARPRRRRTAARAALMLGLMGDRDWSGLHRLVKEPPSAPPVDAPALGKEGLETGP